MSRYRLRPGLIDAEPFDGSAASADRVIASLRGNVREIQFAPGGPDGNQGALIVRSIIGMMVANPGDYVLRGADGSLVPCKAGLFRAAYEPVEQDDQATLHLGDEVEP